MSILTFILLLVIWTLASIIYGIITILGSSRNWNLLERAFLLPFTALASLLRIKL